MIPGKSPRSTPHPKFYRANHHADAINLYIITNERLSAGVNGSN
jgi:hypothetical protein